MENKIIKGTGFHHIALKVANFEKSCAFYEALGFTKKVEWGDETKTIRMYDIGDGGIIEMFSDGGDEFSESGKWIHFAVTADDVDQAFQTAVNAGGKPFIEPKTVPLNSEPYKMTIRVAFVTGPDGEQIEFFKVLEQN